jgi:L-lactate dehydrogenase (cytochrome)
MYHPPELVESVLPSKAYLGRAESSPTPTVEEQPVDQEKSQAKQIVPLHTILNLDDVERAAENYLAPNAWAYYSSAADDELTKQENRRAYQRVYMRPRILRDVEPVDVQTTILGQSCSMPVFVSPAAMAKLAHPDGECAIAAAAGHEGVIQIVSTSSSIPIEKIMEARPFAHQPVFFQLYVHRNRSRSEALVRRAEKAGAKAIWITVDAPVMGKREKDDRVKAVLQVGIREVMAARPESQQT